MPFKISTKGFPQAVARLNELGNILQTAQFVGVLTSALEPIRDQAIANIHSISGRTAAAIVISPGLNPQNPSANIKLDRRLVKALWKGKPFTYPYAVEYGHGGPHPAPAHPFFSDAFKSARAKTRAIVNDGIKDLLNPYTSPVGIGGEFT